MNHQTRKYSYSYDNQHRLTAAYYQVPGTVAPRSDSYSTSYSYDENGNILNLKRNGVQDWHLAVIPIDDLHYRYDEGNRLKSVRDAEQSHFGYNDRHTDATVDDFEYDDYGNIVKNRDKEIVTITYNHLNLPVKITFTGGETIEYTYLADGTKIRKEATDQESTLTTTTYLDSFQYIDDVLEFFPTSEGYVKALPETSGTNPEYSFHYIYTHTDHLGNIRVKYTKHPETGELTILEENHYYPYGLTHEGYNGNHKLLLKELGTSITIVPVTADLTDPYKYKFNGMEYQDEFDVNLYDFGARNYDPALGRWMNIDPMAELMRRHSPYNYAFNNPVFFIDPDGMMPIPGALKSGLLVQDTNFFGVSDIFNGNMGSTASGESMAPERNNSAAYKNYFQQVRDYAANADESLGGGKCPDGEDCDENVVSLISDSKPKVVGGHVFSGLELALEKSTEYIVGGIFDKFGWNKDYQDGAIIAASLFFSKGGSSKVAKSINQLNKAVHKGKTPKGIIRFDKGRGTKNLPQDEVHFKNGSSLYRDGTWRHNKGHKLTNDQIKFLKENGWKIP